MHTGRTPYEMRAEIGGCIYRPGMPEIASKAPKVRREPWNRLSLTALRRNLPRLKPEKLAFGLPVTTRTNK